ncbi:MAG: xanthine dehydrogenase family protein molybdopterin-binding subunit [Deltaproteobacteria bacterium]|nr:MAG: xanthine dehydrogenase family protein molybdopterin-binding subunit [Deltaproteobacteria bacterium]
MEFPITPPIGERVRRKETLRFVTGTGRYVDDLLPPDTLHAAFVRSACAHARIKAIDVEAARTMPGVHAVFTGEDIAQKIKPLRVSGSSLLRQIKLYPLAVDKVRYFGEPLAVVVADNRYLAEDAVEIVSVDYEPLPVVVDPEAAMEPASACVHEDVGSNIVYKYHFATDGIDKVFQQADVVIKERIRSHRITACPIEPRAYLAHFNQQEDSLTMWSATANPHSLRTRIADILSFPESRIRVIAPDVGGSFGIKIQTYQEELLLPFLSRELARPVKWCETRVEHLRNGRHGRDQIHYIEMALKKDGTMLGIRDKIIADMGSTYTVDHSIMASALYVPGVYQIQNYSVDAFGVSTNKTTHGSLRGIGKADASYVIERLVDIAARELRLDPVEIRMKNFIPAEAFPYRNVTGALYDSGQYHLCLERALEIAGYEQLRKEQEELRRNGQYRGIGVALVMEPTSSSRIHATGGYASCRMRIDPSGAATVFSSMGEQGQGHETTIAQIVASQTGIPFEKIHVIHGDTLPTPYGFGTGSSRSSVVLMPSAWVAAKKMREKMLGIAARSLGVVPDKLDIANGKVSSKDDPGRSVEIMEIVRTAYGAIHLLPENMEPGLETMGYFVNPNIDYTPDEKGRMNTFSSYPYAAIVAVVDVDVETGFIKIIRYCTVHDCGNMINPQIVDTQQQGSIMQGIGAALYEELRYDEEGQLLTSTLMDYRLPSVEEVPEIALEHIITPNPFTPLGAKGAGETGMLGPPPALCNAVEDALSPLGVKIRETPLTPERILDLIEKAKSKSAHA